MIRILCAIGGVVGLRIYLMFLNTLAVHEQSNWGSLFGGPYYNGWLHYHMIDLGLRATVVLAVWLAIVIAAYRKAS